MSMSQPHNDVEAQFRLAASEQRLWPMAQGRANEGDASAQRIVDTCEQIQRDTVEEADRLRELTRHLSFEVDPDSSGQLHLVTIRCKSRENAMGVSRVLVGDGYLPWQLLEGATEEVFFRTNSHQTFVQLGEVTRTIVLYWPESKLVSLVPSILHPTARDWSAVAVPRFLWWSYFAIRPFRLFKERVVGLAAEPLALGPILSTPTDLITQLLEFAELESDDHLVDLGCGDGRILERAAREFDCRATGVDHDVRLVERARSRIANAELEHRVSVHQGDANTFDLRDATVVFLFIPAEHVAEVAAQIRARGFAGRIISHEQRFVEGTIEPSHSAVLVGERSLTVAHRW